MRKFILLLILLAGCNETEKNPQEGVGCAPWASGLMVGTSQSDELLDVLVDEQGNVYLAGYKNGLTGSTNIEPAGNAQGIVLKYDRKGTLLATVTVGTSGASTVEALALDAQTGEIFLTGRTNGSLAGYTNAGQYDLLIGWLNRDEWVPRLAQFGDERPQHPRRITLGLSGEIIVAGYDDVYVPTNYVEAWENPLLAKYGRDGNGFVEIWDKPFDTPQIDSFSGLAVDATTDGAIYVTGHDESLNGRGIFVARYDGQGSEIWRRQISTITYDNGVALHRLANGNILLAGSTFQQLGDNSYGQMDIFAMTLDPSTGEPLWTSQYGSPETDWVTDMAVDATGQIYLVGETMGSIEPDMPNPDKNAIFLIKMNSTGNLLLARQWNSGADDYPTAVSVDACECAFITGYTTGSLAGQSNGGRDGFVLAVPTSQ